MMSQRKNRRKQRLCPILVRAEFPSPTRPKYLDSHSTVAGLALIDLISKAQHELLRADMPPQANNGAH